MAAVFKTDKIDLSFILLENFVNETRALRGPPKATETTPQIKRWVTLLMKVEIMADFNPIQIRIEDGCYDT